MRRVFVLLAASCCSHSQTADHSLTFEVASVKPAGESPGVKFARKSSAGSVSASSDSILFRRNATQASLLQEAYGLRKQQVIGPAWLSSERYEIQARVPEGTTADQQLIMLQNLLVERFQMKLHRETREMPVYEMVTAKGGPKLQKSVPGDHPLPPILPGAAIGVGFKDGVRTASLRESGTMEALAARLSPQADRLVIDRTGLDGNYDVVLRWTLAAQSPSPGVASDPGISLAGALESQLGLRLDPKKSVLEVLIIDHAEKLPTEN